MLPYPIEIKSDMSLQQFSYGYPIHIITQTYFDESEPINVLIKHKISDTTIVKDATLVDSEQGIVMFMVDQGDFEFAGTYRLQVRQLKENTFNFLSSVGEISIAESIDDTD